MKNNLSPNQPGTRALTTIILMGALALGALGADRNDESTTAETNSVRTPSASAVGGLLQQLRDLDAASQQERQKLLAQLLELEMQQVQAAATIADSRNPIDALVAQSLSDRFSQAQFYSYFGKFPAAQEPQWFIGVWRDENAGDNEGFKVGRVQDDSPAAKAGLKVGDNITACNGIRIKNPESLSAIVNAAKDQSLNLEVVRPGREQPIAIKVIPAERPAGTNETKPDTSKLWNYDPRTPLVAWMQNPYHAFTATQLNCAALFLTNQSGQIVQLPWLGPPPSAAADTGVIEDRLKTIEKEIYRLRKLVEDLVKGKAK